MTTVLIVDDVPAMAEQYAYDLARLADFEVLTGSSGDEGLEIMRRTHVDCLILDLEMPGMDGFQVLRTMKRRGLQVPVIVYTGTGNYQRCVQAVQLGAYGFIDKAEPMQRVVLEVQNAVRQNRQAQQIDRLEQEAGAEMIGSSQVMARVAEQIGRVAGIPSPVLIVGESGTGKEVVARQLHRRSKAVRGPFLALNCAALPEQLVESELFGHEKGAFTGADRARPGAFETAEGGTLFLDEIGELPPAVQAKLLRVLENQTFMRLGESRERTTTARVIAATNRDLDREVAEGRFREDLLYRLNVHLIEVPPLRERPEDIPELARYFTDQLCRRFGLPAKRLGREALAALVAYQWRRNNVRELRNAIERMIIANDGEVLGPQEVPFEIGGLGEGAGEPPLAGAGTLRELKAQAERRIVEQTLVRHGWRITETAESLGLADHSSLLKVMKRLGIKRPDRADPA